MRVWKIFVMILVFAFMLWGCVGGSKEEANGGNETNATQQETNITQQTSLEELEKVRTAFKNFWENATEDNYQTFIDAVDGLTGNTPEENFFRGVGVLARAYQDNKPLLKNYFGVDNIDDLKEMDEDELFEHFLSVENANYNQDLGSLFSDLEGKLKQAYNYFEQAESGIGEGKISIDLGEESPYFDKYDFKILKAIVKFVEAINYLGQAIDFGENINWNVTVNGQSVDLRELIINGTENDTDISEEDILREFLKNNPDLLTWKNKSKLSSFKQAIKDLKNLFVELKNEFNAMDNETLFSRNEHAFEICDPEGVVILEGIANFLDSFINAFNNKNASLILFDQEETSVEAVQYRDRWFKAYVYDYYKVTLSPSNNQEITIYNLVSSDKSLRDLLFYLCENRPFYDNKTEELWKKDVYDFSKELETYEIPLANNISIDGNAADWQNVKVFREYSDLGIKIKIARDGQEDAFYMYIEGTEGLAQDFIIDMDAEYYDSNEGFYFFYNIGLGYVNISEGSYDYAEVKDNSGNIIGLEVKLPYVSNITKPRAIIDIWVKNAGNFHYEELKLLPVSNE